MEKKLDQINLKVTFRMKEQLEAVCRYEGVGMAELIRGWIRDRLTTYRQAKRTKDIFEELKSEKEAQYQAPEQLSEPIQFELKKKRGVKACP